MYVRPAGIVVNDADCCVESPGSNVVEDIAVCKCIVPVRYWDYLIIRRAESFSKGLQDTASCLDNMSPQEMVNYTSVCFDQYLRKAANHDLYKCSDGPEECGRPKGVTCLPTHLVNDFYIPILSFGKKCGDFPDLHELHMEDWSETASTSNDDSGTQEYHTDNKDIAHPRYTTYSSPIDKSSLSTISSFENIDSETSTLNSGSFINDDIIIPYYPNCDTSDSSDISHLSKSSSDNKKRDNDMDYSSTLDYAENSATSEIFSSLHLIIVVTGLIFSM
ncbi:hypothetical protein TNCV_4845951 [Trichonephila clavipes]|uniref:Uncharacterized protein n=1 Tax=Trichonephila clavipes TaxID=2585209 RepID=A0A8X6WJE6_TRICX|nr:hypothetical protein TNCV_4845951 [Trichonephila clavipes]